MSSRRHPPAPESASPAETEPDYRFLLANERTFLAYLRTALALDAPALAIDQLLDLTGPLRLPLVVLCALLALTVAGASFLRWRANDRAIRAGARLPAPRTFPVVAVGLVLISLTVLLIVLYPQ